MEEGIGGTLIPAPVIVSDEMMKTIKEIVSKTRTPEGCLFVWDEKKWQKILKETY